MQQKEFTGFLSEIANRDMVSPSNQSKGWDGVLREDR
jgi:hypothetical protein